jgi:hypothetical protein
MDIRKFIPVEIPIEAGSRQKAKEKFKSLLGKRIFFKSRSTEKWVKYLEQKPDLRFHVLPMYIGRLVREKVISEKDAEGYMKMLFSNDQESWGLGITILRQFKTKKKKK